MKHESTLITIRAMSIEDRIELIQIIWDELSDEEVDTELTQAQKEELDRRLAKYEADPDNVIPWEQAKAQIKKRLQQ